MARRRRQTLVIRARADHSEPAFQVLPKTDCKLDQSQFNEYFRLKWCNRGVYGRDVPILDIKKQALEVSGSSCYEGSEFLTNQVLGKP